MTGRLRIVAGELRGRRIRVPPRGGVRPTADRVREALFSILGDGILGANVLDLFSGSGALGLEALSRGASNVVFVDSHPGCCATIRENAATLGVADRCRVVEARALQAVEGAAAGRYSLVLADPPYDSPDRAGLGRAVEPILTEDGQLVVERSARAEPTRGWGGLGLARTVVYGDTALDMFRRDGPG